MGLFWDYFRKTLRFPLIWRPGPLAQLAKGGGEGLDQTRSDITWLRDQFTPETCDTDHMAAFARSRGLRRWPSERDDFWKRRVVLAYEFYRRGGTKPGMEQLFELAGMEAEIIEPAMVRAAWEAIGGRRLDGSWGLDGSVQLKRIQDLTDYPYLDWAEFAVRVNLASLTEGGWEPLLRYIVSECKPARSRAIWVYTVGIDVTVSSSLASTGEVKAFPGIRALSCDNYLDGTWRLGKNARHVSLDGSWRLDGGVVVGQVIPAVAERRLVNCRVRRSAGVQAALSIPAGIPDLSQVPYFQLSSEPWFSLKSGIWRKLDGRWAVGAEKNLDGTWRLDGSARLGAPKLGQMGRHRLGTGLKIGYRATCLDGSQKVGLKAPECETWPVVKAA